jgi:cytochrome c-type biogenesis protein CcmE
MLLAGALIYTSFSAATDAKQPSQLLRSADSGRSYQLTGKVVQGSVVDSGAVLRFSVRDRNGTGRALPVTYTGEVPDPFRGGREIIVKGTMRGGTFVGQNDSLVTKCPSKFQAAPNGSQT